MHSSGAADNVSALLFTDNTCLCLTFPNLNLVYTSVGNAIKFSKSGGAVEILLTLRHTQQAGGNKTAADKILKSSLVGCENHPYKSRLENSAPAAYNRDHIIIAFQVTDNGAGIPESVIPTIFSPFGQQTSVRGKTYSGTGLGLR
jgi:signal transduction histidine kinase